MARTEAPLDRLGFLLARHGRVMNVRLRQALSVAGLSPGHGSLLARLARDGATSQQALLEALAMDASGLVAILNDLEHDGLVERRRDPADRRRHIVEITEAGCRSAAEVERAITEVEQDAFAQLDENEVAQLRALLARVHSRSDGESC